MNETEAERMRCGAPHASRQFARPANQDDFGKSGIEQPHIEITEAMVDRCTVWFGNYMLRNYDRHQRGDVSEALALSR